MASPKQFVALERPDMPGLPGRNESRRWVIEHLRQLYASGSVPCRMMGLGGGGDRRRDSAPTFCRTCGNDGADMQWRRRSAPSGIGPVGMLRQIVETPR